MQVTDNGFGVATQNVCDIPSFPATTWPAILAGALAAVALSIVLFLLGSGFGLAAVSPWSYDGVSAVGSYEGISPVTFTAAGAIWLIITQWLSSALGGYMTGRLRRRWPGTQGDEIFFRDTAHGFLTWVVATVFTAAFFTSAAASVAGGTAKAATTVAAGAAAGAGASQAGKGEDKSAMNGPDAYFVDILFRPGMATSAGMPDGPAMSQDSAGMYDGVTAMPERPANMAQGDFRGEATRIFAEGRKGDGVSDADKAYLTQVVAARTGLSQPEAAKRVDDVTARMNAAEMELRKKADTARKTAATASIFMALSMLIGAFVASASAVIGGRCRDEQV